MKIKSQRDFWSGLMFVAIGLGLAQITDTRHWYAKFFLPDAAIGVDHYFNGLGII